MIKCKIFSQERLEGKKRMDYAGEGFAYDSRQELEDRMNKWFKKNISSETQVIHVTQSFNECGDGRGCCLTGGISISIFYRD